MIFILRILFVSILFTLFFGIYHKSQVNFEEGEFIIGSTVLLGAFIFLPLFLYHRWNGKRLQDYTLSEKNLNKIRYDQDRRYKEKNQNK